MAFVIAEPCIGTKDTACVDACPVDCVHPKKNTTPAGAGRNKFSTYSQRSAPRTRAVPLGRASTRHRRDCISAGVL
jgi:NAD-dependent dihydropyrimidine dehydrogenase PreA subunit